MNDPVRTALWGQFGAAIDTLENVVRACPEDLWGDRSRRPEFWYLVFHTLYFLDYYLAETDQGFQPPAPFTNSELLPATMPERVYTKEELLRYLEHGRTRARGVIGALTAQRTERPCGFPRKPTMSALELHVYNLRHVQHHAAQLNLILRQTAGTATPWVSRAGQPLGDPAGEGSSGPPPPVSLREITKDNLQQVLRLRVGPGQEHFVAANAVSLAQAHFSPEVAWFRAVYAGDEPAGFVMLEADETKPQYYLWRFMIDQRWQGRGVGRGALELLLEHVRARPGATELLTSVVPGEGSPGPFYEKIGFAYTGAEEDGERVMRRPL